jgi:hypothetical protein
MNFESLSNQELLKLWAESWQEFVHKTRDSEPIDEAKERYIEIRDEVCRRGLGTKDRPPHSLNPTEEEDIYANQ